MAQPRGWPVLSAVWLAIMVCSVIGAPPARAAGDTSCGKPWTNQAGTVYTCDLWPSSSIPVFAQPNGDSQVGKLNKGGWANWFTSQTRGATYTAHGYQNNWWARTMADNGQWGYVSEVYFAQGANFERDASLPVTGQASPPSSPQGPPASPQGPPGSRGAGQPQKPKPPTANTCAPRQPVVLRIAVEKSDPGAGPPGYYGDGPSKRTRRPVHTDAIAPVKGGGTPAKGGGAPAGHKHRHHGDSSSTMKIGTLQNCVHRTGDKAYGRTYLHLFKGWNLFSAPLIIQTTMHVYLPRAGGKVEVHSPGSGSLRVQDPPGAERPGPHPNTWFLTRASGRTRTGRPDNLKTKFHRPANGTFMWETKPTRFRPSAMYDVYTKRLISEPGHSFVNEAAAWPIGETYAGWSPATGVKNRAKAMADLTMSWDSGLLLF